MYEIFKILDFVTEIELYSDKCGKKEMQKLQDDYAKDLIKWEAQKVGYKPKANLWRYVAEDKEDSDTEETKKGGKGGLPKPKKSQMVDQTVSQNSKTNKPLCVGFYDQFRMSKNLMHFKITHYNIAVRGWKDIGLGLAESKSLRSFSVHGTNLA
jgi:hypothetical protein